MLLLRDFLVLGGFGSLVAGAFVVSTAAGLLVGGVSLLLLGLSLGGAEE